MSNSARRQAGIITIIAAFILALGLSLSATVSPAYADDPLPAPGNPHWRTEGDFYDMAVWTMLDSTYADKLEGYNVVATWKNGSSEVTSDAALVQNNDGHEFDTFIEEHGEGTYTFTVQAIAKSDSGMANSDVVTSNAVEMVGLSFNVVTLDEDGNTSSDEGGRGFIEVIDDWGKQVVDGDSFYYPKGTEFTLSFVNYDGYVFNGFDFVDTSLTPTVSGDKASFALNSALTAVLTFQENNQVVDVVLDLCAGHEALASSVAAAVSEKGEYECTASGSQVIIKWPLADKASGPADYVTDIMDGMAEDPDADPDSPVSRVALLDNDEYFMSEFGHKQLSEYADEYEASQDAFGLGSEGITEGLVLYAHWSKPVTSASITIEAPLCGTTVEVADGALPEARPTVTAVSGGIADIYGDYPTSALWVQGDDAEPAETLFTGTFKGGDTAYARLMIIPASGYYLDSSSADITVNGQKPYIVPMGGTYGMVAVVASLTVEHDWDEGTVTTEPTCTAAGVKTFTCQADGCDATKTEAVDALGHEWGDWTVVKEATATAKGLEQRVCAHDASHVETREIPAKGESPEPEPEPSGDDPAVETYSITFDLGGGTLNGQTGTIVIQAKAGETIKVLDAPTREGYTFLYWKGSEYHPGDSLVVTEDHTLTAMWQKDDKTITPGKTNLPATGDGTTALPLMLLALASLAVVVVAGRKRLDD